MVHQILQVYFGSHLQVTQENSPLVSKCRLYFEDKKTRRKQLISPGNHD